MIARGGGSCADVGRSSGPRRNQPEYYIVSNRYVSHLRVSTPKQGENGLDIEAQREAVRRYLMIHHGEQIAEFVEVETGKRSDRRYWSPRWPSPRSARPPCWFEARSALAQRRVHCHVDG